jgi:SPOR domain
MKKLFVLLLVANVVFFGYMDIERMNSASQAASDRFKPFNTELVRSLSAQQVARLGPAKVAQLTLACAEWGPLSEADRVKAVKLLEPLLLGRTMSARRVDVVAEHWIYIPPKATRAGADRSLADLKKLNVTDSVIVLDGGPWNLAISLGVFRSKESADARLAELKAKGVKTATYRQREQTVAMNSLVLREPTQAILARLEELKAQVPGSAVSTGACPEVKA